MRRKKKSLRGGKVREGLPKKKGVSCNADFHFGKRWKRKGGGGGSYPDLWKVSLEGRGKKGECTRQGKKKGVYGLVLILTSSMDVTMLLKRSLRGMGKRKRRPENVMKVEEGRAREQ